MFNLNLLLKIILKIFPKDLPESTPTKSNACKQGIEQSESPYYWINNVYMNEYVWKWQIRKRSRNMAIVCTIEMDDQTDLRKLGSWEISGWSAMEIWNIRTYLGFFEELGNLCRWTLELVNCWKYPARRNMKWRVAGFLGSGCRFCSRIE